MINRLSWVSLAFLVAGLGFVLLVQQSIILHQQAALGQQIAVLRQEQAGLEERLERARQVQQMADDTANRASLR